jgi:protein TonB
LMLDLSVPAVSIDVPISAAEPVSFGRGSGESGGPAVGGVADNSAGGRSAYEPAEVERQVSVIPGSARPQYPAALRSNGIEGEVVAQFVVDEKGRVPESTVKIVSATNELFATSVRVALTRMKFHPAEIGGRAVPQMVQQLFSFRLDR